MRSALPTPSGTDEEANRKRHAAESHFRLVEHLAFARPRLGRVAGRSMPVGRSSAPLRLRETFGATAQCIDHETAARVAEDEHDIWAECEHILDARGDHGPGDFRWEPPDAASVAIDAGPCAMDDRDEVAVDDVLELVHRAVAALAPQRGRARLARELLLDGVLRAHTDRETGRATGA